MRKNFATKLSVLMMTVALVATPTYAMPRIGSYAPITVKQVSSVADDGVPDYEHDYLTLNYNYLNDQCDLIGYDNYVSGRAAGVVSDVSTSADSISFVLAMDIGKWQGGAQDIEYYTVSVTPDKSLTTIKDGDLVTVYGEVNTWTDDFGYENGWSTVSSPYIEAWQVSVYPAGTSVDTIFNTWHSDDNGDY